MTVNHIVPFDYLDPKTGERQVGIEEYNVDALLTLSDEELVDIWIDALCDSHPLLALEMVSEGIGPLGTWFSQDVGRVCGCLVGSALICKERMQGHKLSLDDSDEFIPKLHVSNAEQWTYHEPSKPLAEFLQTVGPQRAIFDRKVIEQVGLEVPGIDVAESSSQDWWNDNSSDDHAIRIYLTDRIVANLLLLGWLDNRGAGRILRETYARLNPQVTA